MKHLLLNLLCKRAFNAVELYLKQYLTFHSNSIYLKDRQGKVLAPKRYAIIERKLRAAYKYAL